MRKVQVISIVISLCFLLSCVKDGKSNPNEVINHVNIGDPVPSFVVSDDNNKTFNSAEFIGKHSLLVFFETSCKDCKKVLPIINNEIWEELRDDPDFLLVTISRGEDMETINKYWNNNDNKFTMPKFLDPERRVFSLFANNTIPRLYVINKEGVIIWMAIEELSISANELISIIKQ